MVAWILIAMWNFITDMYRRMKPVMTHKKRYLVELRNNSGKLVGILENAHNISITEEINTPRLLKFDLPANDDKINLITVNNQIWIRDLKNDEIILKAVLQQRRDKRG